MTTTRLRGTFAVTKALAAVEPGPADESGPGTFSLILSTADVDRDGEIVDPGAFEPLPDHIAMDIDHGMSVATTVASGRPYYGDDGSLRVDGTFASTELGQNARTLVREGHIRTASVAMIPTKKTKTEDGTTRIVKADLLNGAFTPVPSNRKATVLSAKSAAKVLDGVEALLKAGARNSAGDQAIVQAIHDLTSNLGAICGDGSSEEGNEAGTMGKSASLSAARALIAEDATKTSDTGLMSVIKATHEAVTKTADADTAEKSAADAAAKAAADAADSNAADAEAVQELALRALTAARDL